MLTVLCVLWGDKYPAEYAYSLKKQVEKNLHQPFRFRCVTDQKLDGIETIKPLVSYAGWWQKIGLFHPDMAQGRTLYLDLDVCIVGSLDGLCEPVQAELRIAKNWAQSGHGGCQSSVMFWTSKPEQIHNGFDPDLACWPPRAGGGYLWGDQEHITKLRDAGMLNVEYFAERDVLSYKYHCRGGLPEGAKVAVFHGKPDPHEVGDEWVKAAR